MGARSDPLPGRREAHLPRQQGVKKSPGIRTDFAIWTAPGRPGRGFKLTGLYSESTCGRNRENGYSYPTGPTMGWNRQGLRHTSEPKEREDHD